MPHVIIKMWPGKSEQQKTRMTEAVTKAVMASLGYGEESVSVGIAKACPISAPISFSATASVCLRGFSGKSQLNKKPTRVIPAATRNTVASDPVKACR